MKLFKMDNDDTHRYFQNKERSEERLLFREAKKLLSENESFTLKEEKKLPYVDCVYFKYGSDDIILAMDMNDGAYLQSDSLEALEAAERLLE